MAVDFRRGLRVQMTVQSVQQRRTVNARGAEAAARRKIQVWASKVLLDLQRYPPTPPEQFYRRTGDLRFAWHIREEPSHGAIAIVFENRVRDPKGKWYANWVMGNPEVQQAQFAARGWRTAKEVILGHKAEWNKIMREVLRDAIRSR